MKLEQEQKDIVIAQLKAENFELKKKEKDYNLLKNQLMDLERRFNLLQEEKRHLEADANKRDSLTEQTTDNLQAQIRMLENSLATKQKQLKDADAGIYSCKTLLGDKDLEIEKLKSDQIARENNNQQLIKENRLLENDIVVVKEARLNIERDTDNLIILNEQINKEKAALQAQVKDAETDIIILRKRIEEAETRLDIAQRRKVQKESELVVEINNKNSNRDEVARLNSIRLRLEQEINELATQVNSAEVRVSTIYKQCDDRTLSLNAKENELIQSRLILSRSEDRSLETSADLRKARENNERLQRLLDQYKKDVGFQKKLREIEMSKKLELEEEKRRLQNEALNKEIEARSAIQYLERVKDSHEQLLGSQVQLNEELNALKQHAEVLESQNMSLHNELERFVETDEVVRHELDRKPRVDYIKSKNTDALQQSIIRVRNSQSPVRRSPSSNYGSQYISPAKY